MFPCIILCLLLVCYPSDHWKCWYQMTWSQGSNCYCKKIAVILIFWVSVLQCFSIRHFFSFPFRTLFIGSVGSIFLSEFGWHSVFIFHGLMALLWAYLWRFYLQLPQQKQKRQQFALGNIKMVEPCCYERAALMNVPWKLFARHSAVWLVFFGLSWTVTILRAFLEVKIVSVPVHTLPCVLLLFHVKTKSQC